MWYLCARLPTFQVTVRCKQANMASLSPVYSCLHSCMHFGHKCEILELSGKNMASHGKKGSPKKSARKLIPDKKRDHLPKKDIKTSIEHIFLYQRVVQAVIDWNLWGFSDLHEFLRQFLVSMKCLQRFWLGRMFRLKWNAPTKNIWLLSAMENGKRRCIDAIDRLPEFISFCAWCLI